jgi:hypothetical protein
MHNPQSIFMKRQTEMFLLAYFRVFETVFGVIYADPYQDDSIDGGRTLLFIIRSIRS